MVLIMQMFRLTVNERQGETDIIGQAVSDVLLADVISKETKDRLVDGLTVLRSGLSCTDYGCQRCFQRRDCERLVEDILATT